MEFLATAVVFQKDDGSFLVDADSKNRISKIRNYLVYSRFIPLSLGAGQTLLEGIGDYDAEKRFNMPKYDWDVYKQEAEMYNRPDYDNNLARVDGIERDRLRVKRALEFVGRHPFWFGGTMIRRALWMIQPEKTAPISVGVPISRALETIDNLQPIVAASPAELFNGGATANSEARVSLSPGKDKLILESDEQKYAVQFVSGKISAAPAREYVLRVRLALREGRVKIQIRDRNSTRVLAQTTVDPGEDAATSNEPNRFVNLPFVADEDAITFAILNEAPPNARSIVEIANAELFELGAARLVWTRPLRIVVSTVQKIFTLPVLLPLELLGVVLLVRRRQIKTVLLLLVVPFYYFAVQSALHTEYRYVLAIHHFLFVFAAVASGAGVSLIVNNLKSKIVRIFGRSGAIVALQI